MAKSKMFIIQKAYFNEKHTSFTVRSEENQFLYCPIGQLKHVIDDVDFFKKNADGEFMVRMAVDLETGKYVNSREVFKSE